MGKGNGDGEQKWGWETGWVRVRLRERAYVRHLKEEVRELLVMWRNSIPGKGPRECRSSKQDGFWNILETGRRSAWLEQEAGVSQEKTLSERGGGELLWVPVATKSLALILRETGLLPDFEGRLTSITRVHCGLLVWEETKEAQGWRQGEQLNGRWGMESGDGSKSGVRGGSHLKYFLRRWHDFPQAGCRVWEKEQCQEWLQLFWPE